MSGLPPYKLKAHADLIAAVRDKDLPGLSEAIRMGADLNACDDQGRLPLALAAAKGDAETLTRLLHHGASPAAKGGVGHTALYAATSQGHVGIAKRLLKWEVQDTEDLGAAARLAAQRDMLPLCAHLLKRLAQLDEARVTSVLQSIHQQDQGLASRLDQAILAEWVAAVTGTSQAQAELEVHREIVRKQQQDLTNLVVKVAGLMRHHQPQQQIGGAAGAGADAAGGVGADGVGCVTRQQAKRVRAA